MSKTQIKNRLKQVALPEYLRPKKSWPKRNNIVAVHKSFQLSELDKKYLNAAKKFLQDHSQPVGYMILHNGQTIQKTSYENK